MILLLNAKGPIVLEASNLKMDDKQVPGIFTYIIIYHTYTHIEHMHIIHCYVATFNHLLLFDDLIRA